MSHFIKSIVKSLPPFKKLIAQREALRTSLNNYMGFYPPGHFYSPIPSPEDRDEARRLDRSLRELPAVDLNVDGQLRLLDQLAPFYQEQPFSAEPAAERRYYFDNIWFGYSDAIFLYALMRFAKPKRIIEIGSGYSSFVMLDTNELFFDDRIRLTFIEPNDERLRSRLREKDVRLAEIIPGRIQDVPLTRFDELGPGDILFVDSSHVSKLNSDLNRIVFEILPRLAAGVLVHFHDVFYPFDYPNKWIDEGRFWNEDYLLRAFLQYNSAFKIAIWNEFLATFHADKLRQQMPLCLKDAGASLWLQRV